MSKDLEDILLGLSDDKVEMIIGRIPNPANISVLDYSILKEVLDNIRQFSIKECSTDYVVPDWDRKIQFNGLSYATNIRLNNGSFHINDIKFYMDNQSRFCAEDIQKRLHEIYRQEKSEGLKEDMLFWSIVNKICPEISNSLTSSKPLSLFDIIISYCKVS